MRRDDAPCSVLLYTIMGSDKEMLRAAIIRTSLEIGSQVGEEGLTMRGIASKLGVSATALYQHFDSKASILEEVRVHGINMLHGELASSAHIPDPANRIISLCKGYITFARTNPWLYRLIAEQEADWDELNDEQREQTMAPLLMVRRWLAEGKENGQWHEGFDVDMNSLQMWVAVHGLCSLLIAGRLSEKHPWMPVPDQSQFISNFVNHLIDSFRA